jgi:iron complex outermembrane receptor protein
MVGLNKPWGYSYLNATLFDDLQDIPDGSRDSARHFTYQITDIDASRPIVPASVLNSYAIPVLHQHVQLYRIYDNSNIALGGGNLNFNLGYQFSHRREFTHPQNATIPGLNLQLTTLTYDIKYNYEIAHLLETTMGVNGMYQNNTLGENSTDFPIPAYNLFDIGPFLVIIKSIGKLDISGGIRFDNRWFSEQAAYIDTIVPFFPSLYNGINPSTAANVVNQFPSLTKDFSGVSGSLGATYNFTGSFLLKGNIARGYRSPSIAELSANGADPGSQIYHVGNPDFKPEFSLQEDIGAFLSLANVSVSVELYENKIQNYIFQRQILNASGQPERVNPNGEPNPNGQYSKFMYVQSTAQINGGELNLDIHPFKWLHFANSLTLTYGTNTGAGNQMHDSLKYLPFIPPLHTHSELKGNFSKGFARFRSFYANIGFDHFNAQNRFYSAYGTETYTAGYNLISGGIGANIVNSSGTAIAKFYIEGTNLANISYQSNMSRLKYFDNPTVPKSIQPGIFNMGRNISVKLIIPFDISPRS